MTISDRLGGALTRLSAALEHLESAADRRAQAEAGRADQDQEFILLQNDRSELAAELDRALARSRALLAANEQVSTRLDRASASVTAVLARFDSADRDQADEGDVSQAVQAGIDGE